MVELAHEESFESRTQAVGTKRSSVNTAQSNRPRKRRRNVAESQTRDSTISEDTFFAPTFRNEFEESSNNKSNNDLATSSSTIKQNQTQEMAESSLGRNRLAMGFVRPQANRQDSKSSGEVTNDSSPSHDVGQSSFIPIEISDDEEMEESEGGMVINLEHDTTSTEDSDSDTGSEESGEIATTPKSVSGPSTDASGLFVVDPTSSVPLKKLADLSAAELNDQLRYAFFHLNRDEIDLERPVICLVCFEEGHLQHDCGRNDTPLFRISKQDSNAPIKLWISCCVCASKSHLVGDCPKMTSEGASRWSLKSIDSEQIVNMNLETGMRKLEDDAMNKGMRPENLQIKGRAGLHHAGGPPIEISSEDEGQFLRKPIGRQQANIRVEPTRSQRYDRYDPPSNQQPYRGGGQWYATDSFGRRRSRSPDDRIDSYRPRDDFARSRVSPQGDSWRPPPPQDHRDNYRPRAPSPARDSRMSNQASAGNAPGSNIRFSLPTRKGSNTWLPAANGDVAPSSNAKPNGKQKSKAKYNNRNNKKKASKNGRSN